MSSPVPTDYAATLESIKRLVHEARYIAQRRVNTELLRLYWQTGATIIERQKTAPWGSKVLSRLSADLRTEFPGAKGFSPANLKYMRRFAEAWPDPDAIGQRPVGQLPWGHVIELLESSMTPSYATGTAPRTSHMAGVAPCWRTRSRPNCTSERVPPPPTSRTLSSAPIPSSLSRSPRIPSRSSSSPSTGTPRRTRTSPSSGTHWPAPPSRSPSPATISRPPNRPRSPPRTPSPARSPSSSTTTPRSRRNPIGTTRHPVDPVCDVGRSSPMGDSAYRIAHHTLR
ncbi:hypothetical protein GFS60_07103 (plasmid) [Rhodococcus sp. WAY2]|nr:hypothetical protein GFS60_07103 [Rhodococcus sp. WAY2]